MSSGTTDHTPQASRLRRQTVTLRDAEGMDEGNSLPDETLPRVRAEMSLQVLAYNLKRALNIFGTQLLVAFMRA